VKFSEIFKVEANAGWLDLQTGRGLLLFELGPKAEIWAEKIKNPKALVEKLGVDAQKKIAVVGKLDPDLRSDLDATGAKIAKSARARTSTSSSSRPPRRRTSRSSRASAR